MNKIKATVSGNIQNVGYRAKVIGIAKDFGLTGFVQNLDDGQVRVIAESDNGTFEKFLDAIRIENTLINVRDIKVEYADATGDFADFYKLVGGGETDERLDTAAEYLKKLISVTERGFENLDSKMDVMTDEIRGLREDMKSYMDMKFGEIESELSAMKNALNEHGISY